MELPINDLHRALLLRRLHELNAGITFFEDGGPPPLVQKFYTLGFNENIPESEIQELENIATELNGNLLVLPEIDFESFEIEKQRQQQECEKWLRDNT